MILTGSQIAKEIQNGNILLEPFDSSLLNPNSYNYRLNDYLLKVENKIINPKDAIQTKRVDIPEQGYKLQPHQLYLASTYEVIGSDQYVVTLIGRSSLGRLGLFLQISADLGHLGTQHKWTLELTVVQPLIVYARMRIGQVSFWIPEGLECLNQQQYRNQLNSYAQYNVPYVCIPSKLFDEV